jgi:alpha-tubulin suppressor-like RCC1 family protein
MSGIYLNWRRGAWTCALSAASMATWAGAPSITSQPVGAGVQRGQSTVFTVVAKSAAPATALTYQWFRNGVSLAGATGSSYTTPVTALTDDNALYSVQVRSAGVTVTSTAARLTVVPGFVSASTGSGHSEVLGDNGSVWIWGNSLPNLRANPSTFTTDKLSRAKTSATGAALSGVAELSAGMNFVLARRTDNTLVTWGDGYLGDGSTVYRPYPVPVRYATGAAVGGMVSISAGGNFAVAARSDGTVWSWGSNTMCVLGTDPKLCASPGPLPGAYAAQVLTSTGGALTGVVKVAAGSGNMHALALKSDDTVWSWGTEQQGQLGNGTAFLNRSLAKPVLTATGAALTNVASISAGAVHSVAVLRDGTVYAWGLNTSGQLGIGTASYSTSSMRAVRVLSSAGVPLTGVAAVAAGSGHTLFLKTDGSVWGVGANDLRQLGSSAVGSAPIVYPMRVLDLQSAALTGVRSIVTRDSHSVAVRTNGTVYAWGYLTPGLVPSPVFTSSP